jgi:hypothetical protein
MADKSLRLSITVVDLAASVTRVVPAAQIDYILLAATTYMDTTGLFQYKGETLLAADSSQFTFSKPTTEVVGIADISAVGVSKPVAETTSITDISSLALALLKTEGLAATDTSALSFSFATVVESLLAVDSSKLTVQPVYADAFSLSDTVVTVLIFLRNVFDTVTPTDTSAILFIAAPYVETLSSNDASAITFNQQLTEAFAMNDLADVGDGIAFEFIDFTANVVSMSDSANLTPKPLYSDTISLSDTGVGSLQDYCDITYFAEDYVGSRFTF